MPAISICLPVYNGAAFVGDALRSISVQSHKDVVVVASNNASSDGTGEILRRWASDLPMSIISRTEVLPMEEHFNALLDHVDTEFYMLLCHDDYFYSNSALAEAFDIMRSRPDVSAVYSDLAYVGETGLLLAERRFKRAGEIDGTRLGRESLRTARNMFGIPLLVRRSALGTRRYDGSLPYTMDVDLSWEISKSGPTWHIPKMLLANRYSGLNSTWKLLRQSQKGLEDLAAKHGVPQSGLDRARLRLANANVGLQKRAFGAYERARTRLG